MAHVAWTLTDHSTGTPVVWSFPNNPNAFDPPKRRANITEELAVAAAGNPVLFQGRDSVRSGSFAGWVRGQASWDDLNAQMNKFYSLQLTDDLANSWFIIVKEFTPKRLKRALEPHRYDYTCDFLVVG